MLKKFPSGRDAAYDADVDADRENRWFAGALAALLAITVADAVTAEGWILTELLAIPPLVAAVGSGARRTGVLAAMSAVVAVVLGISDDMFLNREHLITVLAVVTVGLTAFYIARLRERLELQDRRSKLMADAGGALQRSLGPEASLNELARLAVPLLADWCVVHVKQPDGSIEMIAVAHREPEKEALIRDLAARYPTNPDAASGVPAVVRTGRAEIYRDIPESLLTSTAQDAEHLAVLRSLGFRCSLMLPLIARGRVLGSIVFSRAETARAFGVEERALAQTLADRAGIALDNTQLYARASDAEAELRGSRDQLGAILDGVADGVTAQDPTGKMVYANEEALRMLGFPSVEAIQAVPIRYVLSRFEAHDEHGRPFPLERLPGRSALRGQKAPDALIRMRRRDTGAEHWTVLKATPIFDDAGELMLAINVYEDVTDHMERERHQRLLARAGELLATSLTYERTLERVAELTIPDLADVCTIDLVEGGHVRRAAVAAGDGEEARATLMARRRYPLEPDATTGVPAVIRAGAAE
ncbi:MAG: hypothetical protein QOJ12_4, partial [Thermoleophilales bacterium]|nr:hypothetical protein [Thermoleophilales bacterium]